MEMLRRNDRMPRKLTKAQQRRMEDAAQHFVANRHLFEVFAKSLIAGLREDPELARFIHFVKYRIKDVESLRAKLERLHISGGDVVNTSNLFTRVTDLAGVRLIHLHTEQLIRIHPIILRILNEQQYELAGEAVAYCWDVEYRELFESIGIRTQQRQSMYTTVHYDIVANKRTRVACELQVRSLMDEVWGEVSHRVNYPKESPSVACRDQLKVLARLTSGCGRLVDSIFRTHNDATGQRL